MCKKDLPAGAQECKCSEPQPFLHALRTMALARAEKAVAHETFRTQRFNDLLDLAQEADRGFRRRRLAPETVGEIKSLIREGLRVQEIVNRLMDHGVSRSSVDYYARQLAQEKTAI